MENKITKANELMTKSIESLKKDLASVSTGRATPDLLNTVRVECYGNVMPLNQISNISVPEPTTLSIQLWDKSMVAPTEKAISNANLGFTPRVEGQTIRINIPKLSEERRKELCKLIKKYGEDKKVSIRNIRREVLDEVKKEKNNYTEDEVKKFDEKIQKLTDEYIKNIDIMLSSKEKDIMAI